MMKKIDHKACGKEFTQQQFIKNAIKDSLKQNMDFHQIKNKLKILQDPINNKQQKKS